jgi:predicted transposase YdaD
VKPFDASLNALIDAGPADWVNYLAPKAGLVPGPAEALDTDLSVTAQADKAFRLFGPPATILHIELEGNPRLGVPADLLRYNVLLGHGREEYVYSVIVLLRPKANASDLTGVYTRPNLEFRYSVVRVWEETVAGLLAGGPTTAPLALLTNEAASDVTAAAERVDVRLRQSDVGDRLRGELWSFAGFFGGLRYDKDFVKQLVGRYGVILEDSAIYQEALEKGVIRGRAEGRAEGRADEARRLLLIQSRKRFGAAPASESALEGVGDTARLERMAERVLEATGWDDLLATP